MIVQRAAHNLTFTYQSNIECTLRQLNPCRNKKYYYILQKTLNKFIQTEFKLNLTADAIIKECESARPTWYSYFRSVESYYSEIFQLLGEVMLENMANQMDGNVNYRNWTSIVLDLRMEVFLANTKNLVGHYPGLNQKWEALYDKAIKKYTSTLSPVLQLSEGRTKLFIRNVVNEMIMHPDKYYSDTHLFDRFVKREYILFLAEQNS